MKKILLILATALCAVVVVKAAANDAAAIRVDFTKKVCEMKPMHGVGQPPLLGWNTKMFHCGIETLHKFGFTHVETTLNEWLPNPSHERLGTADQAADIFAMLIGMQRSKLDRSMIYDARCGIGSYSPLFNPMTYKPHKAYYALKAFCDLDPVRVKEYNAEINKKKEFSAWKIYRIS